MVRFPSSPGIAFASFGTVPIGRSRQSLPSACRIHPSAVFSNDEPSIVRRSSQWPTKGRAPSSAFDRALDDAMNRRMGNGHIFYGRRAPEQNEIIMSMSLKKEEEGSDETNMLEYRPNPVVVVGALGRLGEWVALKLMDAGFNVRILVPSLIKAESTFGPDGANLDILEGDVRNAVWVTEATKGASAVVCVIDHYSRPNFWRMFGSTENQTSRVDQEGVPILAAAAEAAGAKRFILVSRPNEEVDSIVCSLTIPYLTVRIEQDLQDGPVEIDILSDEGEVRRLPGVYAVEAPPDAEWKASQKEKSISRPELADFISLVLETDCFCGLLGETLQRTVPIPQDIVDQAKEGGIESIDLQPIGSGSVVVNNGHSLLPNQARDLLRRALKSLA
uniref:Rhodanese domain-containing protein n=1 Tax=Compsopogon caeruleus TaxID=31354 RepID=A0A6T6BC83_9RHOD|mmetsp:Transcript_14760/g.30023  ORF Transcript_14760/g.30023 Transcript_14760/m.30023 type:complete len:389 (+) Transcript_14760:1937-3103(+)